MKTLPDHVASYRRTPTFTNATLPAGLRRAHSTKAEVWGRICVVSGHLRYRILEPTPEEHLLAPGSDGIIEPKVLHEVEPQGDVAFFVEFLKTPKQPTPET